MTEEKKTTSRQRYDARRRAAANERPILLARIDELEDSVKYLYQENKELKAKVFELEDSVKYLHQENKELKERLAALEQR